MGNRAYSNRCDIPTLVVVAVVIDIHHFHERSTHFHSKLSFIVGWIDSTFLSLVWFAIKTRCAITHFLTNFIRLNIRAALFTFCSVVLTMRRRGPPSSLRLVQGPLPPRYQPKHTLPSVPRPVFQPEASLPRGPAPAPRTRQPNLDHLIFPDLPPFSLELAAICRPSSSGSSTPTSSPSWSPTKRVRGPWDDSSCFNFAVDVDSILALPKPVAIGV